MYVRICYIIYVYIRIYASISISMSIQWEFHDFYFLPSPQLSCSTTCGSLQYLRELFSLVVVVKLLLVVIPKCNIFFEQTCVQSRLCNFDGGIMVTQTWESFESST